MRLLALHARYGLIEIMRIPIAVVPIVLFPGLSFLFFALPNLDGDPVATVGSAAALAVFAAMLVCLFQFGATIAEDRVSPWDPAVRTLPVAAWQRIGGRVLVAVPFILLGALALVLLAWATTDATIAPGRLLLGLAALIAGSLPVALIGIAVGYSLPTKAAIAVANVLFFPLAYFGGLLIPVQFLPEVVADVSPYFPTRGWAEIVYTATLGTTPSLTAVLAWAAWIPLAAALAIWAYRRDEGRRYR